MKLTGQEIVNLSAHRVGHEVPNMYSEREAEGERKKTAAKYLADKRVKEAVGQLESHVVCCTNSDVHEAAQGQRLLADVQVEMQDVAVVTK